MRWYYYRQKERVGPVEESVIRKLVSDGTVSPSTYIWNEGMGNQWVHVSDVPGLKELVKTGKPVVPAVAAAPSAVAAAAVSAVAPVAVSAAAKTAGSRLKFAQQPTEPAVDPGVEERAAAVIAEREAAKQARQAQHRRFFGYSCPDCGARLHRGSSEGAKKWFGVAGVLFSMAFGELYCTNCGIVERKELPPSDRFRLVLGSVMLVVTAIVVFVLLCLLAGWLEN